MHISCEGTPKIASQREAVKALLATKLHADSYKENDWSSTIIVPLSKLGKSHSVTLQVKRGVHVLEEHVPNNPPD